LQAAIEDGLGTVRIYRWREATISLGYFQTEDDFRSLGALSQLPAVRRLSGGGAILHDDEWTYSIALPAAHPLMVDPVGLYEHAHRAVMGVVSAARGDCRLRGESLAFDHEPFLCFGRGDPRDLVVGTHKVLGSAQRRRRGAVLQHGSLLMRRSPHANNFPGLKDLFPDFRDDTQLGGELGLALIREISSDWIQEDELPATFKSRAQWLAAEKYSKLTWSRELIRRTADHCSSS